ncbi:trypsin-like serine protease [Spirillospora sp. NPDC049652]
MRLTRGHALSRAAGIGLAALLTLAPTAAHADGADRDNDSPNFSGGARISVRVAWWVLPFNDWRGTSPECTTGFGVHSKADPGKTFLLTAAHCDVTGSWMTDGSGNFYTPGDKLVGAITDSRAQTDAALLQAPSGSEIYDGGTGAATFKKRVVGSAVPPIGETVCLSGAKSGTSCGLEVIGTNRHETLGGHTFDGLTELRAPAGAVVAGPGDSGGPVFVLGSQPNTVLAVGTVSGGSVNNDGVPVVADDGYQHIWIAPVRPALDAFGVELNT